MAASLSRLLSRFLRFSERSASAFRWSSSFFCYAVFSALSFATRSACFRRVTSTAVPFSFVARRSASLEVGVILADENSSFVRLLARGVSFALDFALTLLFEA